LAANANLSSFGFSLADYAGDHVLDGRIALVKNIGKD